jgi:hypothetical protein
MFRYQGERDFGLRSLGFKPGLEFVVEYLGTNIEMGGR